MLSSAHRSATSQSREEAIARAASLGARRFRVIANPPGRGRVGGYAILDTSPIPSLGRDVEGYGWQAVEIPGPSVTCWFKRKRDALVTADSKNRENVRRSGAYC